MTTALRFHLDGMTCASCVARAERVLRAAPGVASASVNLGTETAEVRFDAPATAEGLAGALAKAGYPARQSQVTLSVEGMTCAACTGRVERVLRAQPGVASAVANLATRQAQVTLWQDSDPEALAAEWNFYLAYNLFRLASITQGIARRVVDGIASSAQARATGASTRPLAQMAWQFAQASR